jgi:hypothetical protein
MLDEIPYVCAIREFISNKFKKEDIMKFELLDYLNKNFKDDILSPALFYNWDIGIRFELGSPYRGIENPEYFNKLIERAVKIFEFVFEENDDLYVIVSSFEAVEPYKVLNQGERVFPKYIKNKNDDDKVVCIKEEKNFEEEGYLSYISYQYCLKCKRDDTDYSRIFEALANRDFCREPYTSDGVYFVNVSKDIIFHMYDDRGLDVVAKNKENLQKLYVMFNNWILDYDRKQIDETFKLG